jgi:hypothetical protein
MAQSITEIEYSEHVDNCISLFEDRAKLLSMKQHDTIIFPYRNDISSEIDCMKIILNKLTSKYPEVSSFTTNKMEKGYGFITIDFKNKLIVIEPHTDEEEDEHDPSQRKYCVNPLCSVCN